ETVGYRIKRMMEKDFLHGFLTLVDSCRLGFRMHVVYLKLREVNTEKRIIKESLPIKQVTCLKNCGGSYDIQIFATSKSLKDFDNFLEMILSKYSEYIQDYLVLEVIDEDFAGIELLLSDSEKESLHISDRKGSTFQYELQNAKQSSDVVQVDEKDKRMLEVLSVDGRIPLAQLSEKIGLAVPAIENRMKRLIKEEVIRSFIPLASFSHLGYQWYKVLIRVKNLDKKKFITYLRNHSNVLWYTRVVGKWNYQFSIFAKDNVEFNRILNEIRTAFADNIISYDSLIIFNQFKFVHRLD
ncbi:MAG: Lrp/AsnC family transcriptional regulator, partial [Nanoarchaeota archaeon]|nr:Lrp/AsnC family transcriptional regulator [Nanoarchaeota archaeon]